MKRFFKFRIKGMSKGSHAVKFLWLTVSLALICGSMAFLTQHSAEELFGWTSTVHRERVELAPNRHISISSADIPLEVYTHDGTQIIVEYVGETALIIYEDELEIKISREEDFTLSLFSLDKFNYKMRVWLPSYSHTQYEEIKLISASGSIYAENIKSASISATSRSGNVEFSGTEGEVIINTRTGNVKVFMPFTYETDLSYMTESGLFSSDFFGTHYSAEQGGIYISSGENPERFTVLTDTGNLEFNRKIIFID